MQIGSNETNLGGLFFPKTGGQTQFKDRYNATRLNHAKTTRLKACTTTNISKVHDGGMNSPARNSSEISRYEVFADHGERETTLQQ